MMNERNGKEQTAGLSDVLGVVLNPRHDYMHYQVDAHYQEQSPFASR